MGSETSLMIAKSNIFKYAIQFIRVAFGNDKKNLDYLVEYVFDKNKEIYGNKLKND
jgi:hypothetical protein